MAAVYDAKIGILPMMFVFALDGKEDLPKPAPPPAPPAKPQPPAPGAARALQQR